ncbi:SERP3 protein, partial [Sapayoa aenigma]|nr:SERP3 protein [Sapayoa aenigma]
LTFMLPIFFSAFILCACCSAKGNCISYDELKELKTEFAVNLYRHVSEAENRTNLVVSPASVVVSLELLQFGAQGNTLTELQDALGYNIHGNDFLRTVYEGVTDPSRGTVVQLACSVFVDAGVRLSPHFAAHAAHWANSSLQQTNFTDPNRTMAQIQEWITGNLADGDVRGTLLQSAGSSLSQVALVSTMYFRSMWQKKFSLMDTQMLPFTTSDGSTLQVPTMHHTAEVNYGNFHTLIFFSKLIISKCFKGSSAIAKRIIRMRTLEKMQSSHVKKTERQSDCKRWFSIQSIFDLKTVFSALGIRDTFDPITANFKGISDQDSLYISEAIHKAEIEITEDGTKASGAT